MFKVKKLEQIAECTQLSNKTKEDKSQSREKNHSNDATLMSLLSILNIFIILIYLSVKLKRLINCRIVVPNQLPAKCCWALDSLSWASVQANPDDKILKIFIEGSVFGLIYFVCLCFCFFFVVKSLFLDGPVEVKSFQHFNVSTMQVSTLRYLFIC